MHVQHLGPLDAESILVFVGRDNIRKKSASLDALACELHKLGLTVCWYERSAIQHARLREAEFAEISQGWLNTIVQQQPWWGKMLRTLVRLQLKIRYPKRHAWVFKRIDLSKASTPSDLRRFIRKLKADKVHILAQSAGSISATLIEDEKAIQKLVCFGYPFKHPDRGEEPYRTAHLATLKKPCLIIQGDQDEYGTARDLARYPHTTTVQTATISSGHDYDGLTETAFSDTLRLVAGFLDLPCPPASSTFQDAATTSRKAVNN